MKVAFVSTRYGLEVNGGAEQHCRLVAERLAEYWNIEILTTCAMDYVKWSNFFSPGIEKENKVTVRRFKVDHERPQHSFNRCYDSLIGFHLATRGIDIPMSNPKYLHYLLDGRQESEINFEAPKSLKNQMSLQIKDLEQLWMKLQGPYSSELIDFITTNEKEFDLFIFFSANYCTSYFGLKAAPSRSALVPTLHQEACMGFNIYQELFRLPKYLLFNTVEEQKFAWKMFPYTQAIDQAIAGVGIDDSQVFQGRNKLFAKLRLSSPYLLYLGRIDIDKGCLNLNHFFVNYKKYYKIDLKLVFAGKKQVDIPKHKDIVQCGFVDEKDKYFLIKNAVAVVIPSRYESLSMVLLESWGHEVPTLVNGDCDVLRGHCIRGNGGFFYTDQESFNRSVNIIIKNPGLRQDLGKHGREYVKKNFDWDVILGKYHECLQSVVKSYSS